DELQRVEILHFTGDAGGKAGGVEPRDRPDPAPAGKEGLPVALGADAERRHQTDSGDDDSSSVRHPDSPALLLAFRVRVDVLDGFLHPGNLLLVLVGDFDAELLLERHYAPDGVQRGG